MRYVISWVILLNFCTPKENSSNSKLDLFKTIEDYVNNEIDYTTRSIEDSFISRVCIQKKIFYDLDSNQHSTYGYVFDRYVKIEDSKAQELNFRILRIQYTTDGIILANLFHSSLFDKRGCFFEGYDSVGLIIDVDQMQVLYSYNTWTINNEDCLGELNNALEPFEDNKTMFSWYASDQFEISREKAIENLGSIVGFVSQKTLKKSDSYSCIQLIDIFRKLKSKGEK